jgi:hypothetical protein
VLHGTLYLCGRTLSALLACAKHVWRIAQPQVTSAEAQRIAGRWCLATALCLELYFALIAPTETIAVVLETAQTIALAI